MPLDEQLGAVDPQQVLDDVIRQRAPGLGPAKPQEMMNRLIRKHVYGQKPKPAMTAPQGDDDFDSLGGTEPSTAGGPEFDELGGNPQPAEPIQQKPAVEPKKTWGKTASDLAAGAANVDETIRKSAAQGLTDVVAKPLQGIGIGASRVVPTQLGVMDRIDRGEQVPMDQDPVGYGAMSPEQRAEIRKQFEAEKAKRPTPEDNPLYQAGKATENWAQEKFPLTPEQQQSIPSRVTKGLASMVPLVGLGLVSPTAAMLGGAAMFGTMGAAETYDDARKKGADPDTAVKAAGQSAAVNAALGVIPLGNVLKPITKLIPGMESTAVRMLAQAGENGLVFTGVGEAQEYLGQQIAKAYNPQYVKALEEQRVKAEAAGDTAAVKEIDQHIKEASGYSVDAKRVIASLLTGAILGAGHALIDTKLQERTVRLSDEERDARYNDWVKGQEDLHGKGAGSRTKNKDGTESWRYQPDVDAKYDQWAKDQEDKFGSGHGTRTKNEDGTETWHWHYTRKPGDEDTGAGAKRDNGPDPDKGGGGGKGEETEAKRDARRPTGSPKTDDPYDPNYTWKHGETEFRGTWYRDTPDGRYYYDPRTAQWDRTGDQQKRQEQEQQKQQEEQARRDQEEKTKAADGARAEWTAQWGQKPAGQEDATTAKRRAKYEKIVKSFGFSDEDLKNASTADLREYVRVQSILAAHGHSKEDIGRMSPKDMQVALDEATRHGATPDEEEEPTAEQPKAEGEAEQPKAEKPEEPDSEQPTADGTREAPADLKSEEDLATAAAAADQDHTHAQGEANNVPRGHAKWNGLDVTIEVPPGGTRKGLAPDGSTWETTHGGTAYGYFRGLPEGADGMHPDVHVGPNLEGDHGAYVIDELDPDTGKFRQTKTVIGVASEAAARKAYLDTSSKTPEMIGGVSHYSYEDFEKMAREGGLSRPAAARATPDQAESGASPPDGGIYNVSSESRVTNQHREAVADAVRTLGDDPAKIDPAILERAAALHASGIPPEEAIPAAVIQHLVADGDINADNAKAALGEEGDAVLHAGGTPEHAASPESAGTTSHGPTVTAETGGAEERPKVAGEADHEGSETGRPGQAGAAGHPATGPGAAVRPTAGGERPAEAGGQGAGVGLQPEHAAEHKSAKPAAKSPVKPKRAQSLVQFIAQRGGIAHNDPLIKDVQTILGRNNLFVPGYGPLIRKGGEGLDKLREAAVEAGYIHEPGDYRPGPRTTTINTLLEHLENEIRGEKQYPVGEEPAGPTAEQRDRAKEQQTEIDEAKKRIVAELKAMNYPVDGFLGDHMERAAQLMVAHDLEPGDALDQAAAQLEQEEDLVTSTDDDYIDFGDLDAVQPSPTPAQGKTAATEDAAVTTYEDEAAVAAEEGARAQAGGVSSGPRAASSVEPGATGGPSGAGGKPDTERTAAGQQHVLPGAERISDAELAKRRASERLKPNVVQKPADEGLFGDESQQTDLVDLANKPPTKVEGGFDEVGSSDSKPADEFGDAFNAALDEEFGKKDLPEHPGLIIKSLETGKTTTIQPPGTRKPSLSVDQATKNVEASRETHRKIKRQLDAIDAKLEGEQPKPRNALDKERLDRIRAFQERIARSLRKKEAAAMDAVDDAKAALKQAKEAKVEKPKQSVTESEPAPAARADLHYAVANNVGNPQGLRDYATKHGFTDQQVKAMIEETYDHAETAKKAYDRFAATQPTEPPSGEMPDIPPELVRKPKAEATDEQWWNKQLTTAERANIIKQLGLPQMPANVLWHRIPEEMQKKLLSQRAPTETDKSKSGWTEIGKNEAGQTLYEDHRGVRSYVENGVRLTEPVQIIPSREGMNYGTDRNAHPEYRLTTEQKPKAPEVGSSASGAIKLAQSLKSLIAGHHPITTKVLQVEAEKAFGSTLAEGKFDRKDMYDALETAINLRVKEEPALRVDGKMGPFGALQRLEEILGKVPTQTVRSEEQVQFQQFSTPPDYSAAVAYAANLWDGDTVLEPSAGTGSLVAAASAPGVKVIANELSDRRADMLRALVGKDGRVTTENAEQINNILPKDIKPTVVVMNPPFSQTAGRLGDKRDVMVGANHIRQALSRLEPNGRLVAIVGRGMSPEATTFRDWFREVAKNYSIRANIGVSGDVYKKYGTNFGTRLLVIDKVPSPTLFSEEQKPVTGEAQTVADLMRMLEPIRNARPAAQPSPERHPPQPGSPQVADAGEGARPATPPPSPELGAVGPGERGGGRVAGGRPSSTGTATGPSVRVETPERPSVAPGEPGGRLAGGAAAEPVAKPAVGGKPEAGGSAGSERDLQPPAGGELGAPTGGERVEVEQAKPGSQGASAISDSLYESYEPQRLRVKGAKKHPGPLVESAAMSSVEPPAPTYKPAFPKAVIDNGLLSLPQIEAVVYAGQAHQSMLPAAEGQTARRKGYFIGDGTGVGKGREVAGIILDNWQQGRTKAVWVSEKKKLLNDAKRDWSGLGQNPNHLFNAGKVKAGEPIGAEKGIAFITYDTLKGGMSDQAALAKGALVRGQKVIVVGTTGLTEERTPGVITSSKPVRKQDGSPVYRVRLDNGDVVERIAPAILSAEGEAAPSVKTRVDQLVDWFGKDFDGVIAFDEAHNMGNAMQTKGDRGQKDAAQKALAGLALQDRLPNARVVYVSATGATEVSNLAYADRLGLWGRGTPFADRKNFINEVSSGGIAAMELIARDMKQLGLYTARNLSYDGVEYSRLEHKLNKDQREIYDTLAEAWQVVLRNIHKALETTEADSRAKAAAMSAFWGGHQRFFNQVITSLQMPSVIKAAEKDLAAKRQVVLQLTNTNEASQERAAAKAETAEDIEDLDITPRDQIIQLVEHSFPTQQYETYVDENGNESTRPVVDSEGNPVQSAEAVAMRDALIDQLASIRVPQGPLDMILDHFGIENVAEVTGRKRRFVLKEDEKTGEKRRVEDSRPGSANQAETDAFQAAKKRVLVFSEAGGTGASYHADNTSASKDARRSHYLVQAGWRADKAVQGFGRTHRTNQGSAPIFHLVTTDLDGQKRFISSIARRLGQLGALTKGQRQAGDQGVFSQRDNLESTEAKTALRQFFSDLYFGHVEDVAIDEFEKQTGLQLRMVDKEGRFLGLRSDLPPITQFLNRLLSLKINLQNKVFRAFSDRLDSVIEARQQAGLLDVGLETVHADKIAKDSEQTVHIDKETGAETKHVKLTISNRFHPTDFDSVARNPNRPVQFWTKSPQGHVFAVAEAPHLTDADTGSIVPQYRLIGPASGRPIERHKLDERGSKWGKIEKGEAEKLWQDEIAKAPEFISRDLHLITGAILPIWDRLKGNPRVVRLNTDDGERLIGRVVPESKIAETLRALGAEAKGAAVAPERLFSHIMDGGRAKLANGWTLMRRMVAGEHRIELKGPSSFSEGQQVKQDGVFSERIAYETRYFIPTDPERGAKVLAAITEHRPVIEMGGAGEAEPRAAGLSAPENPFAAPSVVPLPRAQKGELFDAWLARAYPKFTPRGALGGEAQAHVLARGRDSGVEHLVAIDADGQTVGENKGTANFVTFGTGLERRLNDPGEAVILHHNHPSGAGVLSVGDVAALARPGLKAIWAHAPGQTSRAELTPEAKEILSRIAPANDARGNFMLDVMDAIDTSLGEPTRRAIDSRRVTTDEAYFAYHHIRNLVLERAGLIDYRHNLDIGDYIERAGFDPYIRRAVSAIRQALFNDPTPHDYQRPDRPPSPLRAPGDLGASFSRSKEIAGRRAGESPRDRVGGEANRPEEAGAGLSGPSLGFLGDPQQTIKSFKNFWTSTFQPELVSDRAFEADPLFARYKSAQAQEKDALNRQSESEWNYWNKKSDAERIRFLDDLETAGFGSIPSDPKQAAMARRYRAMLDANWALEKQYGSQAAFVEDYFPHIWEKPDEWRKFSQARTAQAGPTWFQKKRTIDYITEGLAAGLKLRYTNPVDLLVHRLSSGVDMRQRMDLLFKLKDMGLAWEGKQGGEHLAARGWQLIQAPDRKEWVIHPDVQLLWKNAVEAKGLWQAEHVGGSMFRGWMALKNAWVPIRLALSAFHPLHVLHINWSNGMARGIWDEGIKGRNPIEAAKAIAEGFYGPIQAAIPGMPHQGKEARVAWSRRPSQQNSEQKAVVALMNDGGFVPQLSEQLKIHAKRQLAEAWQKILRKEAGASEWRKFVSAALRRPIEILQAPIFEKWIPTLKAAAYLNQAATLLRRRPDLLSNDTQRRIALRAIGKSIDDRFGEMFYGNLFWNRYTKDASIASFLSLGWQMGFIRQYPAAAVEVVTRTAGLLPPFRPSEGRRTARDATNKIANALLYMGGSALILGLMSALFTGKEPEGMDWIFPRIGGENPDGTPRRITHMSYLREVPMLLKHVQERGGNILTGTGEMLWNKLMFEPFKELLQNRDYYGYNIWDENAPIYKQVWQGLKHLITEQTNPMSVSGAKRAAELSGKPFKSDEPSTWLESATAKGVGMSVLGFGPAPGYVEKTPIQNRISYLYREHVLPAAQPEEKGENMRAVQGVRSAILIARRDKDMEALQKAKNEGAKLGLTQKYMNHIGLKPSDIYMFSRLPDADQRALLTEASDDTYKRYYRSVHQKLKKELRRPDVELGPVEVAQ